MVNYMVLELKKNKVKLYIYASLIITIVLFLLIFLLAYISKIENDPDMHIFRSYKNILIVCNTLNLVFFSILSAVMYCKFIIEEYGTNRVYMLFSYPISRGKILMSKVLIVYMFILLVSFISNTIVFMLLGLTSSIFSILEDNFTLLLIKESIKTSIITSIITPNIGIISMGLGYIKKSVPTTIIAAVIFSSLFSNIASLGMMDSINIDLLLIVFMGITMILGVSTTSLLVKKTNSMEAGI